MLPTVARQCDLGIIRNPFGTPVVEPGKFECDGCAMVLIPTPKALSSCPNCLKNLSA